MPVPTQIGTIQPGTGAARIVTAQNATRPLRKINGFMFDASGAIVVRKVSA